MGGVVTKVRSKGTEEITVSIDPVPGKDGTSGLLCSETEGSEKKKRVTRRFLTRLDRAPTKKETLANVPREAGKEGQGRTKTKPSAVIRGDGRGFE